MPSACQLLVSTTLGVNGSLSAKREKKIMRHLANAQKVRNHQSTASLTLPSLFLYYIYLCVFLKKIFIIKWSEITVPTAAALVSRVSPFKEWDEVQMQIY